MSQPGRRGPGTSLGAALLRIATVDASGHVVSVGTGLGLIRALGEGGRKADTAEILVRQLVVSVQVTPDSKASPQRSGVDLTGPGASPPEPPRSSANHRRLRTSKSLVVTSPEHRMVPMNSPRRYTAQSGESFFEGSDCSR